MPFFRQFGINEMEAMAHPQFFVTIGASSASGRPFDECCLPLMPLLAKPKDLFA
jgi:hypothetical protein